MTHTQPEDPSLSEPGPSRAEDCKLLVAITFHYNASRLPILLDVVRTLAEFPVKALHCIIATNESDRGEAITTKQLFVIHRLFSPWFTGSKKFEVKTFGGLDNPLDLPWQVKPLIKQVFLDPKKEYSHFVHLEDDMRFSFRNFSYWHTYRPLIADSGLIPSFIRVEYSRLREELCCVEITHPVEIAKSHHIKRGETVFLTPPNTYSAMYVFDKALAAEYVVSRSFDRDRSREVRPTWETRERAAAGLCWENPPEGFNGRLGIPIDTLSMTVPPEAWLPHLGDRYADSDSDFGKLPVRKIVLR